MKKISTIVFILLLAVFPMVAFADEDNHNISVDEVLTEIMKAQDVSSPGSIDCEAVSDEEFERLGEAVMSVMHPDPKQHELMDQMMGGEGSESLRAMHINMGLNYLDCGSGGFGMMGGNMMFGGMGMMGGGMMGTIFPKVGTFLNQPARTAGRMEANSMMGLPLMGGGFGIGFGWISMILFWVLIIVGIIWLVRFQSSKSSYQDSDIKNNAIKILKERYAKGEITKTEFEKMKKDIS